MAFEYFKSHENLLMQILDINCISGTFGGDFNLAVLRFFLNHQTKVTTNTIFVRTLGVYDGNPSS